MDRIETYAINLIAEGGQSAVDDDMDEDEAFAEHEAADWRKALALATAMATAIKANPQAFLDWHRAMTAGGGDE